MRYWYAYVATFLFVWAILLFGFGLFSDVLREWPIAAVMILGSLIAGSTPMGGGAVAFPFLVFWLGVSPGAARDFGLSIQALGMTSAMIFILCRRVLIQGRILLWTVLGAAFGMILGITVIAPRVPSAFVKLTFTCVWMSFAILTMVKNREFCSIVGMRPVHPRAAMYVGLVVGFTGGIVAALIGVGVELALYTVLVLLYRCDLKIAVPTAVSAMAVTSVIGAGAELWWHQISREVAIKFLAAGPLVIFGAPIGTYIVSVIPRIRTLYVVSILCILQFAWTLDRIEGTTAEWTFIFLALFLASVGFYVMYRRGGRHTTPSTTA